MSADDVFGWANFALIISLIVGVVATYAIVVSGNLRDSALRERIADTKHDADVKIKAARDDADVKIAEAKRDTAKAEVRLAELNRTVSPRFPDAAFIKELAGKPKARVEILYDPNSPDAHFFAQMISNDLQRIKWDAGDATPIPSDTAAASAAIAPTLPKNFAVGGQAWGVTIVVPVGERIDLGNSGTPAEALGMALMKSIPGGQVSSGDNAGVPPGTVRIVVGPKP